MPEHSRKTFRDVKGCDEAKAELQEIVEYLKNPGRLFMHVNAAGQRGRTGGGGSLTLALLC